MGDVAEPEPEREAAPADEGPPQEFHFATLFDGEDTPVALRQLPRVWRAGLALVLAASRARVITTSVLMAAAAGAAVARVALYAAVVHRLVGTQGSQPSLRSFVAPVLGLAGLHLVEQAAAAYQTVTSEILGREVSVEASRRIMDAATAVDLLAFESPAFHDQLQRADAQARFRPMQVVTALQHVTRGVATGVGIVIGIAVVSPILIPLVLLVYAPIGVALILRTGEEHRFVRGMTRQEREQAYVSSLVTSRESAKEERAFGLGPELRRRYETVTAAIMDELRRTKRRQARTMLVGNVASLGLVAVVLGSTGALYQAGRLPLAAGVASLVALQQLGGFISLAAFGAAQLHEAGIFLQDYTRFIELADGAARAVPPPTVTGFSSIATDGLSFTYPGSTTPALADVTIEIPAGQVVALVGENGSGKTTLAKILAGLYGPTGGRLLVDGAEAAPGSVAVLFQDFVRYGFTAADNIAFGDPSRLDEEAAVKEAGARSGAAAVIERLPAGYETRLTRVFEEGVDLSVGQWQRVAIARALFRDAELVILDEPTAALDPRAEAELFDAMSSMMAGRTVVLISHRFSTVRTADQIVVLERGRVLEHGTHRDLLAAGGTYAELFNLQASAYRDDDPEPEPDPDPRSEAVNTPPGAGVATQAGPAVPAASHPSTRAT